MIYYIVFIILSAVNIHYTSAECCGSYKIRFERPNNFDCKFFGAQEFRYSGTRFGYGIAENVCDINVCGDGKTHEGTYCGKEGSCNIFGCNCDGGCIEGNAEKNFHKRMNEAIEDYNNKVFCVFLFEHKNQRGARLKLCGKIGSCINFQDKWKNMLSSSGNQNVVLYSMPNCTGKSMRINNLRPCSDNFSNAHWTRDCGRDDMNDNTESIMIDR